MMQATVRTNSLTSPRLHASARAALASAIFALTGCTAGTATDATEIAGVTGGESGTHDCGGDASAHTLVVKDADGRVLRLAHCPGQGWRYLAAQPRRATGPMLSLPQIELSPVLRAHALTDAISDRKALMPENPLAVFIDGPTGYTFAWSGEGGWRFIGRVSEENP